MSECKKKYLPIFNRIVIFNTNDFTYHGHPNPLQCPQHISRKSIALYYIIIQMEDPRRKLIKTLGIITQFTKIEKILMKLWMKECQFLKNYLEKYIFEKK